MATLRDIPSYISILRTMGVDLVRQAVRHAARYAYWQKFYTPRRIGPREPQFLADLERYEALHSEGIAGPEHLRRAAGVDLYCADGVLRVEFLANGVARVRLSRSGHFPRPSSYAVVGLEPGEDTGEGGTQSRSAAGAGTFPRPTPLPWRYSTPLQGPSAPLVIEGRGLILEVSPHPCRLTFKDADGHVLCADALGAGWQGMGVACAQQLFPGQALYGLGEKAFGLNRRGLRLTMWNTDPASYDPGDEPIYQSTPFLLSQRDGLACGIFFDNTYRAEFDLGQTERDTLFYCADGGELCYYVLAGPSMADVLRRFSDLTGRMPLPARWTLGYQQSRWSYGSDDEVRHVAAQLRAHRIPCDVLYLDIDYMDGYRVFTFDRERFPDPARLIADLRAEGLRTVTSVDPGVKADANFALCADGLLRNAFCRLPDGQLYVGPVWPGDCYFPDFPNARVREWWGAHYQAFLDLGVAGFWNDMNEPAVFFGSTFPEAVQHNADNGPADHRALHNVYGQCMMRAAADAMARLRPDERVLLISRSGYAGLQRYSTSWTGDNRSTWEQLRLSIPLVLNMGLSGQAFTGPDVAGFSGDASGELLARWTAMGAFLPLFRNHSALGSAPQEPYVYGDPYESVCRRYIELRYCLLPYLYTTAWQAAETGLPMVRPLALNFPSDPRLASLDDEFLCGDALLVAPVLDEGSTARGVYLPAGDWYDFWTGSHVAGPVDLAVRAPLEALPLYVRAGSVVPMGPVMQHSEEFVPETLELHVFAGNGESSLYEDDGHTQAYRDGERRVTQFRLEVDSAGLSLTRTGQGAYDPGYRGYDVLLRGLVGRAEGQPLATGAVLVDGAPVEWTTDANWAAPRLAAGMFTRVEVRFA